ncbi:TonB-dependent receptor [Algoriphagus litoralis]|uniref:TonB-dependent receptor n=1 Tax=Algoriphagus litoralis TaxID=2202829 RepID=UPI000DBA2157|nr:TonB-dependent receptor [Algoriphagus litoralis]
MFRLIIAFSLLMVLGIDFSVAQHVLVLDKEDQEPLQGVLIYSRDPGKSTVSDAFGKADIGMFQGQPTIVFQLLGFESISITWQKLTEDGFQIELTPSQITLDIAVISASRWRQNTQDLPSKVRSLNPETLDIRNPSNAADWLASSGEVFVQKSQLGGGSPMIRGFSANRLLYAVDGIRMNTAIFRSGNLQNVISLDPFTLQTTEILFGPGSVMYGSDAIGGVMAFETLSPNRKDKSLSGTILGRYASAYSEKSFHADFTYGSGKWSFLSSVSHFDYGDLKMGKNGGPDSYLRSEYQSTENGTDLQIQNPDPRVQVGSGYDQFNLMQKVKFQASEKTIWEYGFHYSKSTDIPRYDRLIEKREGKLRFARWDYGPQVWMMNNLKMTHRSDSRWFDQIKVIGAHQLFEESRIDRRFGQSQEFTRTEKVHSFSLNVDLLKNLKNENYLTYGFESVLNKVNSDGSVTDISSGQIDPASARYPNSNWSSLASYVNFHSKLSGNLQFQTALRYNYTSLSSDFSNNQPFFPLPFSKSENRYHSITGNIGLIYKPEPSFSISPLISTGFRAPNVDDIGKIFDSEPGTVIVPNPDLKPEYAYNAEINLNKHFQNRVRLDFTAFYTLLDQAMVRRLFTLNGQAEIMYDGELSEVLALQNAAFAKVYGFQTGIEIAISKKFLLTSRYNWQKGTEELEDETKSPSRHAAPAFGLSRLTYQHKKLRMEFTAFYNLERSFEEMPLEEIGKPAIYAVDENGNPFSPSWTIFNLNTTWELKGWIHLAAGIENIGNKLYRPYSSGIVASGRNFTFGIKTRF